MTKRWQIKSDAGVYLGVYDGQTPADAIDALSRDAGYASYVDAIERGISEFAGIVRDCTGADLCEGCGRPITDEIGYAETATGFVCETCAEAAGVELTLAR